MSEWIDFSIYAASNFVLWIMLPLAYRELAVPVMMDRNPEWVAANPAAVQRIARSYWFNNSCIVWGIVTVGALLLVQLGVQVPGTSSATPLWRQLNNVNSALFGIGCVAFAATMFVVRLRLNRWIPPGVRRSATLQPRSAADSVPRAWRIATEVLTISLFLIWLILGVLGVPHSPKFWDGFIFLIFNALIFAVMAYASARRPPNYMDRVYGPAYRHREVRIVYGARLVIVVFGAIALTGSITGPAALPVEPVRLSLLLFQIFFVACLLAFVLIKPAGSAATPPGLRGMKAPELTVSLLMLIAVPIIAIASTSASIPAKCCEASRPSFRAPPGAVSAGPQWVGRWLR
jgi:hypothetical protein